MWSGTIVRKYISVSRESCAHDGGSRCVRLLPFPVWYMNDDCNFHFRAFLERISLWICLFVTFILRWSSSNPERETKTKNCQRGKNESYYFIAFFSSSNNAKWLHSWQQQMAIGVVYLMRHPLKPFLIRKMCSSVRARSLFLVFLYKYVLRRMEYIHWHENSLLFWAARLAQVNNYDCVWKSFRTMKRENTQEYRFPVLAHLFVQNSSIFRYFYVLSVSIFLRRRFPVHVCRSRALALVWVCVWYPDDSISKQELGSWRKIFCYCWMRVVYV